uniref:Uncharacterized protein n=1 Tax=Anguilla anguilla TaxID=7936 RepID=A0A0E9TTW3_ANGAN
MLGGHPEQVFHALRQAVAMVTESDNCGTGMVNPSLEMSTDYATH